MSPKNKETAPARAASKMARRSTKNYSPSYRALLSRARDRLAVAEQYLWEKFQAEGSIAAADCWLVAQNQLRVTYRVSEEVAE